MQALPQVRVWMVCLFVALAPLAPPAGAQDAAEDAVAWQDVITSQIQAFRDKDARAAFHYAGIGFQATFPDAETFFVAIIRSGYAPIMDSFTHSFGEYKLIGGMGVVQQVRFIGTDQQLYDAVYQLTQESGGWRVQGVQLMRPNGVAV